MAFTASFDRPAAPLGIRDWFARKLAERRTERARFAEYFRTYGELSRMSDADLADIGLSRHEIADVAHTHAYR